MRTAGERGHSPVFPTVGTLCPQPCPPTTRQGTGSRASLCPFHLPEEGTVCEVHSHIPLPQPFWGQGRRKFELFVATLSPSWWQMPCRIGPVLSCGSTVQILVRTGMLGVPTATTVPSLSPRDATPATSPLPALSKAAKG